MVSGGNDCLEYGCDEESVVQRMVSQFCFPNGIGPDAAGGGGGNEHHIRPFQRQNSHRLGKMPVIADEDTKAPSRPGVRKHRKTKISRKIVSLFRRPEGCFAVDTLDFSRGVQDDGGVEEEPAVVFINRCDH
jgi:hypothetical protein